MAQPSRGIPSATQRGVVSPQQLDGRVGASHGGRVVLTWRVRGGVVLESHSPSGRKDSGRSLLG